MKFVGHAFVECEQSGDVKTDMLIGKIFTAVILEFFVSSVVGCTVCYSGQNNSPPLSEL